MLALVMREEAGLRALDSFLTTRNAKTRAAYAGRLEAFARWCGAPTVADAVQALLAGGHGNANDTVLRYRQDMRDRGCAPSHINQALSALRGVVQIARMLGMIPWTLEVVSIKVTTYRDTRGPGRDGMRSILDVVERAAQEGTAKGLRDLALVRILFDLGLRRFEVESLDMEHVDMTEGRVWILGKGRSQREARTLPAQTKEALARWITCRGTDPGPLFVRLNPGSAGERLTGHGVWQIIKAVGKMVKITVRPHGLRHAAITQALDMGFSHRDVQRFSRHADLRTLALYDDNRADLAGKVAASIACAV